jgi:hypothetical protein
MAPIGDTQWRPEQKRYLDFQRGGIYHKKTEGIKLWQV